MDWCPSDQILLMIWSLASAVVAGYPIISKPLNIFEKIIIWLAVATHSLATESCCEVNWALNKRKPGETEIVGWCIQIQITQKIEINANHKLTLLDVKYYIIQIGS